MRPSDDRLTIRLGGLLFSVISFVATIPLAFAAEFIVNNFYWGYPGHVAVIGGTWTAFFASLITGIFCLARPSPRAYMMVIGSCIFTVIIWILWFTPLTRSLLH